MKREETTLYDRKLKTFYNHVNKQLKAAKGDRTKREIAEKMGLTAASATRLFKKGENITLERLFKVMYHCGYDVEIRLNKGERQCH